MQIIKDVQLKQGPSLIATCFESNGTLTRVELVPHNSKGLRWILKTDDKNSTMEEDLGAWMRDYTEKKASSFELPISLEGIPHFSTHVLQSLRQVPFGKTVSYGELAKIAKQPRAIRPTGSACGRNPLLLIIPCHRVLRSDGSLGGFSAGLDLKRILLDFES